MIAFVSGQVAAAGPDGAVIDVHGVGLAVQCTPATLAGLRVGDHAKVPTSLVVREDSLTLFGFADDDERTVFELLQTASGVGPRLALAMLAVHTPNALRRAVATEDLTALTKVPGIGKKGAQRIVLELKDRLGGPVGDGAAEVRAPAAAEAWRTQVQMGLINLGWSAKDADAAVDAVAADLDGAEAPPVAALLKSALKKLAK
ncbi:MULTISPECIES: Holliday junction branch migration protein RuvA [Actinomadura]|uniref:Holliday junction branch migration complex subunit RuvA n=1 Tax=Actinomadura montaniterrae TaxID=1803903 RepID=A0A6L3W330_9ACTN|nr:Holliday junction branch migration protein RuvA [Actinomadura montaniterrae]KAB2386006.1 Holliday junction branch migration protein RuvA [Actinomadura montaniterrae]